MVIHENYPVSFDSRITIGETMLATWKSRIIPARSRVFTITLKLRDVTLVDRDPRSRASLQPNLWTRGSFCRTRPLTVTLFRDVLARRLEIPKGNNGWQIFTSRKLRVSLRCDVFDNKINIQRGAQTRMHHRASQHYAQIFHIYRHNSRHKFIYE